MSKDNLKLWELVERTNPKYTKKAKKGALSITAINATSQIRMATEQWGLYGESWGLKNISYSYMDIMDNKIAMIKCVFYYPNGSFEINSSLKMAYMTNKQPSYLKVDDDFMKKLETDVTTKALSKLGFNADVFMGMYEDNRYIAEMKEEFNKPTPEQVKAKEEAEKELKESLENNAKEFADCNNLDEAKTLYIAIRKDYTDNGTYNEYISKELGKLYKDCETKLNQNEK